MRVIKKNTLSVRAFCLGCDSEMEKELLAGGSLCKYADNSYEVFSQEAVNGDGEFVSTGDYVIVDGSGTPYPNSKEYFEANYELIAGEEYRAIAKLREAWEYGEAIDDKMSFAIEHRGLVLNEASYEKYMTAPLYGSILSAAKNAVIVFYSVDRDENGAVVGVSFNFVERKEFERNYEVVGNN